MKKVMAKATIRRALYRWNLEAIGRFGGNLPLFCLVDLLGFATRVAYLSSSSSSNLYLNSVKKSSVILIVF